MATNILMPKWGMSMKEGQVATWLKSEGDTVQAGEAIVEIESDKAVNLVESPASGVLARVVVPVGETVPISTVIAVISDPGEDLSDHEIPVATSDSVEESRHDSPSSAVVATTTTRKRVPASPAAKRLAKEKGVDLSTVKPTGPRGMVVVEDVESALCRLQSSLEPVSRVEFFSDGSKVRGVLYMPEDVDADAGVPTVVLCQGFTYTMAMLVPDMARRLSQAGYAALVFDYRGFGESEGEPARLLPLEQVEDIRAAISFLTQQTGVDPSRISLLGVSLGGGHAVYTAALDERVAAVAAVAPVANGGRWLRGMRHQWQWRALLNEIDEDRIHRARGGTSKSIDPWELVIPDPRSAEFLAGLLGEFPDLKCQVNLATAAALVEYCPEEYAADIAPRPILIIHGGADLVVPISESQELLEECDEPTELLQIEELDHFEWGTPGDPRLDQVMEAIIEWLGRTA